MNTAMIKDDRKTHGVVQSERAEKDFFASGLSAWQVLESLGESAAIVDSRFRVVWVNEPLLIHYKPQVNPVGQTCYSVLFNRQSPCDLHCPVKPVLAHGRPCTVERRFIGPDGMEQWREARAYPIVDGNGRVCYVARISFDITGRKREQPVDRRTYESLERSLGELNRLQLDQLPFQPALSVLTRRELEVLRLMAQGQSNPRIAGVLGISINTVKAHLVHIFNKLGVNDRAQAAVWAARQGLA